MSDSIISENRNLVGWGHLYQQKKYHYFKNGKSACGKWEYPFLPTHVLVKEPGDVPRCGLCVMIRDERDRRENAMVRKDLP